MGESLCSEALRQYKLCVERLGAELTTPPESEATQLYEAILRDQGAELGAARYMQLAEAGKQRDLRTAVEEISAMRDGSERI